MHAVYCTALHGLVISESFANEESFVGSVIRSVITDILYIGLMYKRQWIVIHNSQRTGKCTIKVYIV